MRIKKSTLNYLGIIFLPILFIGCFISSFYLTSYIYDKIQYTPPTLLVQIVNYLIGLFTSLAILKIILIFDENKSGIFDPIIMAQKKIARGDYSVNLNNNTQSVGPYSELVNSVNYMALELSNIEKMRQEFISNVSHEIQSPLTSIRGFSQVLRDDKLSFESRLHYLDIIEAESMRLSKLSDNLLRLASLESDTIKFEAKSYRLDKQLRRIILSCEPQWMDKNINMNISLEEIEIEADEDMINQLFINLLNNSIKFTPKDGSIDINLCSNGDKIELKVSDTGIGIAAEDQNHVFDRFFKVDSARRPSIKGNGLGLSIVKKIVDLHYGTIKIQSKLGEGTTFTVLFPITHNI